jgi:hypothetical protein
MKENANQPSKAQISQKEQGFKNRAQALKSLRELQPPLNQDDINGYLNQIRGSRSGPYIAFRLLALRSVGEMSTRLAPFIGELEQILYHGLEPIDLRSYQSFEEIRRVIAHRLEGLVTKSDLKKFAATWDHLPLLYAVIRVWGDPPRFQAAVDSLAGELARINAAKRSKSAAITNNLEVLARALADRTPEKPLVGKALAELLKIAQALFDQSKELARENLALETKITAGETELNAVRSQLNVEIETRQAVENEVAALRERVNELQSQLKEEKEHFDTLKGHSEEDRVRVVADAISRIRADVLRRLENIRLFADREEPNRSGILTLVEEIKQSLTDK